MNNLLKISSEHIGDNFLWTYDIVDCFSIGILINNGSTSYNTSSSSSCKSVIEDNKLGLFSVSLIEYSFLHKGLKYHYH